MKDEIRSRIFLLIPLFCASAVICADASLAAPPDSKAVLIAQNDAGDPGSGNITPEKVRGVLEMTLRQKWRPGSAADGSKTVVRFVLSLTGQVEGAPSMKGSSGNSEFDNNCMDAVSKIGPLPALPKYIGVPNIPFLANFHAGKAPWVELKLESEAQGESSSPPVKTSPSAPSGQSGWVQPSGSAQPQSSWAQPNSGSPQELEATVASLTAQTAALQQQEQQQQSPPPQPPAGFVPNQQPQVFVANQGNPQHPPAGSNPNQQPPQNKPPAQQANAKTPPANAKKPPQNTPPKQPPQGAPQGPAQSPQVTPTDMTGSQDLSQRVVLLNNNAVVAIADNNYEVAIKKLEEALKIDPTYQQARANLAIAYNNYGLQLKDRPDEAIKIFHKAFALDPTNEKTKINLDTIIQYMGKNPKVFKDRLDLGNKAISHGDMLGAKIEYEAALAIKPDPILQQKLFALVNGQPMPNASPPQGVPQGQPTHPNSATHNPAHQGQPAKAIHSGTTGGAQNPGATQPGDTTDGIPQGGVSQKLDTMYRNLKNLEVKTFGKNFDSDDVLTRLSRLEQKLLGKVQQGKPMRRLDALLMMQ